MVAFSSHWRNVTNSCHPSYQLNEWKHFKTYVQWNSLAFHCKVLLLKKKKRSLNSCTHNYICEKVKEHVTHIATLHLYCAILCLVLILNQSLKELKMKQHQLWYIHYEMLYHFNLPNRIPTRWNSLRLVSKNNIVLDLGLIQPEKFKKKGQRMERKILKKQSSFFHVTKFNNVFDSATAIHFWRCIYSYLFQFLQVS